MSETRTRLRHLSLAILICLLATACSSGSTSSADTGGSDEPAESTEATEPSGDPIVIGGTQPLSGEGAAVGEFAQRGAELAARLVNDSGGVLGRQLEFAWEDSQLDPQVGVQTVESLLGSGIQYVLTGGSSVTLAQVPVVEREGAVLLNPMAQTPALAGASESLFNMLPTSDGELRELAELTVNERDLGSVAILHVDADLGIGDRDAFTRAVEEVGSEVVAAESYPVGATDMRTPLIRIRDAAPDALFMSGNPDELGNAIRQARELGIDAQLVGRTQHVSAETLTAAGDAADGMIGVGNVFRPEDAGDVGSAFAEAYEAEYGEQPSVYAAISYDAIRLLAQAMTDAGTTDPADVSVAMRAVSAFDGAMGAIEIGDDQTASYPLFRFEVVDGEVKPLGA